MTQKKMCKSWRKNLFLSDTNIQLYTITVVMSKEKKQINNTALIRPLGNGSCRYWYCACNVYFYVNVFDFCTMNVSIHIMPHHLTAISELFCPQTGCCCFLLLLAHYHCSSTCIIYIHVCLSAWQSGFSSKICTSFCVNSQLILFSLMFFSNLFLF